MTLSPYCQAKKAAQMGDLPVPWGYFWRCAGVKNGFSRAERGFKPWFRHRGTPPWIFWAKTGKAPAISKTRVPLGEIQILWLLPWHGA